MPARRLVVAAASGVAILSMLISTPAGAANKRNGDNNDFDGFERTTTTVKRKAADNERRDQPRRTATTATAAPEPEQTDTTATTRERERERATTTTTSTTDASVDERTAAVDPDDDAPDETTSTTTEPEGPSKHYLVVFKKGNRASSVADEHKRTRKVKVQRVLSHAVTGYEADIPDDEIDDVRKDPRVAYVAEPKPIERFAQTLPWGVERVSRTGNDWSSTRPGDGGGLVDEDIYVIDTGIQPHPDLNAGVGVSVRGGSGVDCDGHGTHMAGIAGAMDNDTGFVGVAPGVRLHGIRVLDCNGRGTDLHALAGLDWVIQNGARPSVITMSFGGPISQPFDEGVRRAVSAGFTVIAAAGNDHKNACTLSPAHMGELNGVITVGATTKNDRRASFSNFGPCVDVYAPGVRIPSYHLNGRLASATGTSASAPHVAGAAALYLSGSGGESPAEVEAAVKAAAVRIGNARNALLRASSAAF